MRLLLRLSRISSAGERCSRVVAGGSPSSIRLLYSKMRSMTSCFPNNIRKKEIKTGTRPPSQPTPNPSTPIPPPAPGTAFASPGAGVKAGPERAKGHPEGLALTPARTAPHFEKPGAAAAIGISAALRQAQGTGLCSPFDKLRAHCSPFDKLRAQGFARPSTGSGHIARPSTGSGHMR